METRRANDAERRASEAITLARSANEAKLIAQRDATRANEELRLYKMQYDNAQREIFKAQELIDQIEAERQEAEAAAARARSTARKLKEQNLIIMAREEGRLVGYQEGLTTGRRMAFEERMRAGDYTEESDSDDEVILPEHPSNIRLRSPTPGTGSRPSSRLPAARQPPPAPPPPMR
jgi:flagellar biosynthesis/type III secretory pathway protein FliH